MPTATSGTSPCEADARANVQNPKSPGRNSRSRRRAPLRGHHRWLLPPASCVRQQRADASYEHTAGGINDWLTKQGHPSFAQWVADKESGLYELELILTEGVDGMPIPKTERDLAQALTSDAVIRALREGWVLVHPKVCAYACDRAQCT